MPIISLDAGGSYTPDTNRISVKEVQDLRGRQGEGPGTAWFHECGHYIDFNFVTDPKAFFAATGQRPPQVSNLPSFVEALKRDVGEYERQETVRSHCSLKEARNIIGARFDNVIGGLSNGIQDIFGGVLGERYPNPTNTDTHYTVTFGHDSQYWKEESRNLPAEAFAHMFEAAFSPQKRILMGKIFPTAYPKFMEILEDLSVC